MNIEFNTNYYQPQNFRLKPAVTNPNFVSAETPEELSFKGKQLESKKLCKSLTALSAAVLGILGLKKKAATTVKEEAPKEMNEIEKAEQENPEFFAALRARVHYTGRDEDREVRNYSDETISVLSKYNKQDPNFAYELAKVTETKRGSLLDKDQTEFLAKNLKEKPEVVEKIQYEGNPTNTLKMLEMHKTSPKEIEGLVEVNKTRGFDMFTVDEIETLIEPYRIDSEALIELANMKNPQRSIRRKLFDAKDIAYLTPRYKEDKDKILELQKVLKSRDYNYDFGKAIVNLLDYYKESPKPVEFFVKSRFYTPNEIKKAVDLYNTKEGAKYFEKLCLDMNNSYLGLGHTVYGAEDFIETVSASIENDKFLTDLEEKVPNISKELNMQTLPKLNKLSEDDKKNVYRIIQDGRIPYEEIVTTICDLLPVYSKYPDKTVTDEMIKRYNDPLAKIFNV